MSEDDYDGDYESGPFCRHWADPSDCEVKCATCGHGCTMHGYGYEQPGCDGVDHFDTEVCHCPEWNEPE